jgi:hypothetical protein
MISPAIETASAPCSPSSIESSRGATAGRNERSGVSRWLNAAWFAMLLIGARLDWLTTKRRARSDVAEYLVLAEAEEILIVYLTVEGGGKREVQAKWKSKLIHLHLGTFYEDEVQFNTHDVQLTRFR